MSGAFLNPDSRRDSRQRELDRNMAAYHESIARTSYNWATALLIIAMVLIATPQVGITAWNGYVAGAAAVVMTALAVRMMIYRRVWNGIICLICAFVVLPGWVVLAADVVRVGQDCYQIVAGEWKASMR